MPATSPTMNSRPTVNASSSPAMRSKPKVSTKRSGGAAPGRSRSCRSTPRRTRSSRSSRTGRRRPGEQLEPEQRRERQTGVERLAATLESRQATEQAEIDGERIAAVGPLLDAIQAHADVLDGGVAQRENRQGRRVVLLGVGEREPREGQQPQGGGPPAKPARILERRGCLTASDRPCQRRDRASEGSPRIEGAEDVAEQQAREGEPDPEHDVDEGGGEVRGPALNAGEPGVDDGAEDADPDDAAD